MQHRRDAYCLADFGQSGPAIDLCRFRSHKTGLATGNGITSSGKHNDIMLDQFLDYCNMPLIQRGSGVVSPNHPCHTSYAAVDDVVIEGDIGSPEGPTQVIVDRLVAESGDQIGGVAGNHNLLFPVREIFNGGLHDSFGIFKGGMFVKFDMQGIS